MRISYKAALVQCPGWGRECPPHALACLAAYVRAKSSHKVFCFDFNNRFYHSVAKERPLWDDKDLYSMWEDVPAVEKLLKDNTALVNGYAEEILATGARVVSFTTHTTSFRFSLALAEIIKRREPETIVIFGGPQCSRSQAGLELAKNPWVDATVTCEGEEILLKILDAAAAGEGLPHVPGMIINKGPGSPPLDCGEGRVICDINELPFADYSDFAGDISAKRYNSPSRLEIFDSRGCPTRCRFCSEWQFWKKYRQMKGERIYSEIEHQMEKYPGVDHFYFIGSLVNGNPAELEKFCDLAISGRPRFSWEGQAAVTGHMTPRLISKMARAGCRWLGIGIEAGSPRVRNKMGKRFSNKTALGMFRDIRACGIKAQANFMFGIPGETRADFRETTRFLVDSRPYLDSVLASQSFCVLDKHTTLYRDAKLFGIENREHHIYWSSQKGKNSYPERFRRYDEFCKLALFLGLPEISGVKRTKPDKWLLLGDYYFHRSLFKKALTCYRRSHKTENFRQTALSKITECSARLKKTIFSPPPRASVTASRITPEANSTLNNGELLGEKIIMGSTPPLVTIGAHMSCNADCVFCQKDELPHFSLELYKELFEHKMPAFLSRAEKISFVGFGELLRMRDIGDFLGHINRTLPFNWKILTTNGTLLDENIRRRILDGSYSLQISLHTADPAVHRRLTRLADFSRIVKNIEQLVNLRLAHNRQENLHISMVSVLTSANIDGVCGLLDLAASTGVQELRFEYMTIFRPEHAGMSCFFKQERANEAIRKAMRRYEEIRGYSRLAVKFPPLFDGPDPAGRGNGAGGGEDRRCEDPWRHIYVESQGTVLPCCFWGSHIGDIRHTPIEDIWNAETYRQLRASLSLNRPGEACSHCIKRKGFEVNNILCHITARPENRKRILERIGPLLAGRARPGIG